MAGEFQGLEAIKDPVLRRVMRLLMTRMGKVEGQLPDIGTVTQALAQNLNSNNKRLTLLQDPDHPQDAVNLRTLQRYVEAAVDNALHPPVSHAAVGGAYTGGISGGGGGGPILPPPPTSCDPTAIPPPGSEVPGWMMAQLSAHGATNCFSYIVEAAMENYLNTAQEHTLQRNTPCASRARWYYKGYPWVERCGPGHPEPQADFSKYADVFRADGGWTYRKTGF